MALSYRLIYFCTAGTEKPFRALSELRPGLANTWTGLNLNQTRLKDLRMNSNTITKSTLSFFPRLTAVNATEVTIKLKAFPARTEYGSNTSIRERTIYPTGTLRTPTTFEILSRHPLCLEGIAIELVDSVKYAH
jgi:hypothetical protein